MAREKGLEVLDRGLSHAGQLCRLDDPPSPHLLDCLLGIGVQRQVGGEPIRIDGHDFKRRRLVLPLRALDGRHLIELAPRPANAAHGGHQHDLADRVDVGRALCPAVGRQPLVDAPGAIPRQAVDVVQHRVERVAPGRLLDHGEEEVLVRQELEALVDEEPELLHGRVVEQVVVDQHLVVEAVVAH